MGDFWGIEKISKAKTMLSNNGGISMALVNTSKGAEIFAHIIKSEEYEVIDCSDENYCLQLNLSSPTKYPLKREEFWQSYEKNGIEYVMNKYGIFSWKNRIKNMIGLFISKAKKE